MVLHLPGVWGWELTDGTLYDPTNLTSDEDFFYLYEQVSESRGHSRAKLLMEKLEEVEKEDEEGLTEEDKRRYEELRKGDMEEMLGDDMREWVEGKYQQMVEATQQARKNSMEMYSHLLIPRQS